MRVVLVGSPSERARLRIAIVRAGFDIVGELASLDAAQAIESDAIIIGSGIGGRPIPSSSDEDEIEEPLTAREIQVLELLAEGLPNKAIAARLHISDQTVKFHVASISGKLGAKNRTDAVRRAVRRGLITL
jgi:DNA-binding CsgD family transcriptional regulator